MMLRFRWHALIIFILISGSSSANDDLLGRSGIQHRGEYHWEYPGFSYRIYLQNYTRNRVCCQIEYSWTDTWFRKQRDRRMLCVYPGREQYTGPLNVTTGIGCIDQSMSKDNPSAANSICINKNFAEPQYRIASCQ
jgi:hypothetical protein